MRDVLVFQSPWWLLGWAVDSAILSRYLRSLLERRNEVIRAAAEADELEGGFTKTAL